MVFCGEVGELLEQFQWFSEGDLKKFSEKRLVVVKDEIVDIQLYLIFLVDFFGVDIVQEFVWKIEVNVFKYFVYKVKGRFDKYNEFQGVFVIVYLVMKVEFVEYVRFNQIEKVIEEEVWKRFK